MPTEATVVVPGDHHEVTVGALGEPFECPGEAGMGGEPPGRVLVGFGQELPAVAGQHDDPSTGEPVDRSGQVGGDGLRCRRRLLTEVEVAHHQYPPTGLYLEADHIGYLDHRIAHDLTLRGRADRRGTSSKHSA